MLGLKLNRVSKRGHKWLKLLQIPIGRSEWLTYAKKVLLEAVYGQL